MVGISRWQLSMAKAFLRPNRQSRQRCIQGFGAIDAQRTMRRRAKDSFPTAEKAGEKFHNSQTDRHFSQLRLP